MIKKLSILFTLSLFILSSCEKPTKTILDETISLQGAEMSFEGEFANGEIIPNQFIVTFAEDVFSENELSQKSNFRDRNNLIESEAIALLQDHKVKEVKILHSYGHAIKGFTAKMTQEEVDHLAKDKRVKDIEPDRMIILKKPGTGGGGGGGSAAQTTPWGISRVGGVGNGTGKTAWVIDSGVDLDHPDLNVDANNSISFLSGSPSNQSPDDQHGHGTHVAGTIGAINNTIGVVGVAANATIVAVRVLDRRGSGSNSGVIAGVNYVAANGSSGDVANMSLGGGVSTALDNAVISAAATGVKFVLAAGNESDDANNHSPARANGANIYTISAMDSNDNWAYFSNYGTAVDYCAPGVSINSTWKSGGYNSISGTSMAAPHAAGILLLGAINTSGTVNGDPDGNPDSIAHQ